MQLSWNQANSKCYLQDESGEIFYPEYKFMLASSIDNSLIWNNKRITNPEWISNYISPLSKLSIKVAMSAEPGSFHEDGFFKLRIYAIHKAEKILIGRPLDYESSNHIIVKNIIRPLGHSEKQNILLILKELSIQGDGKLSLSQYVGLKNKDLLDYDLCEEFIKNSGNNSIQQSELESNFFNSKDFKLYDYQWHGFNWLNAHAESGLGAILADEMGLGKTIQIIRLICQRLENNKKPSLIICPISLAENWKREIIKFTHNIQPYIHLGPMRSGDKEFLKSQQLVICSYETATNDKEFLKNIEWDVVALDEAQQIKNPKANRTLALKELPRNSGIAVTGTPFENRLTDLWSLLDFANTNYLGTLTEFREEFNESVDDAFNLESIISPIILRRKTKEVLKDMPDLIEIDEAVSLSDYESNIYEQTRTGIKGGLGENELPNISDLMPLRQLCAHPFLVIPGKGLDPEKYSTKYERLIQILSETTAIGQKSIIFTHWIAMINLMAEDLKLRFNNIPITNIKGDVSREERQNIVEKFNKDEGSSILIMNYETGAVGLNIQSADNVILYNPNWNPAKEDQAIKRAHRVGRERLVKAYRIFGVGTLEEAMRDILERKRAIGEAALVGNQTAEVNTKDLLDCLKKSPLTYI